MNFQSNGFFTGQLKLSLTLLIIYTCLFEQSFWGGIGGWFGPLFKEISIVTNDSKTQWIIFSGLMIDCLGLILLRYHQSFKRGWNDQNSGWWFAVFLVLQSFAYLGDYSICSRSTTALSFLLYAMTGQGMARWWLPDKNQNKGGNLNVCIILMYLGLLFVASLWHRRGEALFFYQANARLAGPWNNPNTFGLLVGTGMVLTLAMGWGVHYTRICKLRNAPIIAVAVVFLVVMLMGRSLLYSFCRGAWVAVFCGVFHLLLKMPRRTGGQVQKSVANAYVSWLIKHRRPFFVMAISMISIGCWEVHTTNCIPVRRAMGILNQNDFSWRNRVTAWDGDWQMMAENMWSGLGWNQPERLYEHYYLPAKLTEGAAIEMNDYLMLGATLGVPALFCFGMHVWLMLTKRTEDRQHKIEISGKKAELVDAETRETAIAEADWRRTTCHAGAMVLLVGFWFDGGLFKLPTATTFWILLELGAVQPQIYFTAKNAEIKTGNF